MSTAGSGRKAKRAERTGLTNRRSLLTLATACIGALVSLPARAHHRDAMPDAEPLSTLPRSGNGAEAHPFADLKSVGAERQIRAIRYVRGAYRVMTADGKGTDFPESDLRFKVDSSAKGPFSGKPVILPAGDVGDRAWVFFAAPDEISTFIAHQR